MPRMSAKSIAISMTKSDSWTTSFGSIGKDEYKQFCFENCPHPDNPCKGDCQEMKEYRKTHKRKRKKMDECKNDSFEIGFETGVRRLAASLRNYIIHNTDSTGVAVIKIKDVEEMKRKILKEEKKNG